MWKFRGWELVREESIKRWYVVVAPIVGFSILLFFVHLFLSPFKLSKGLKQELAKTEKELNKYKNFDSPIRIEYKENDPNYYHKLDHGQHHRISIENLSDKTIEDVSIGISEMKPLHQVFERQLPLFLEKSINVNPGKMFITVIQWVWAFGGGEHCEFITSHSSIGTRFTVDDKGHEILITVTGKNIPSISKRFCFGIKRVYKKGANLWYRPME
ncbi:MAG: hypothetical protein AAB089_02550 [Nitrospirota bacterium]